MGVNPDVIEKYSVYSMETAVEMSRNIAEFANSDLGVGITGKIDSRFADTKKIVHVSIYDRRNKKDLRRTRRGS